MMTTEEDRLSRIDRLAKKRSLKKAKKKLLEQGIDIDAITSKRQNRRER